jgi:hypothetical protein
MVAGPEVEDVLVAGVQAQATIAASRTVRRISVVVKFIGKLLIRSREGVIEQTSPEAGNQAW